MTASSSARRAPHPAVTTLGKERTMPSAVAISPSRPAAGTASVATPSGPVSALAPAEPHGRAAHGLAPARVVVATHGHAQRVSGGGGRALGRGLQRALAAARPLGVAPEPQQAVIAAQAPAGPERAGGVGGRGGADPAPDLVDPAVLPAVAVGPDALDEQAARVGGPAPAGAVVAQPDRQAEAGERGQRRAAPHRAAAAGDLHRGPLGGQEPRRREHALLADDHRGHLRGRGGRGRRRDGGGRAGGEDGDASHRTKNTTRLRPRASWSRLPARSTAITSST